MTPTPHNGKPTRNQPMEHDKTATISAPDALSEGIHQGLNTLAEDARALLAATAEVAGEKVDQARSRLTTALEQCHRLTDRVRAETRESAAAAGAVVRAHPYQAVALGAGVGALVGYLFARRCLCSRE